MMNELITQTAQIRDKLIDPHYVYVLKNIITGKCYVGCTRNPKHRIKNHMYAMKSGKHNVEQINIDCAKYGVNSFTYMVLEEHDKLKALQLEAFYSAVLRSKDTRYGYNYKDKKGTGIMYVVDKWRTISSDHDGTRAYHYIKHNRILEPKYTYNHG